MSAHFMRRDPKLIERRLALGEKGEQTPTQRVLQPMIGLCFLGLLIVSGLDARFGWSRVPLAMVVVASALFVASLAGIFWVFRVNSFASSIVTVESGQRVIDTGPYALVRHPMYTGGLLFLLSMPVVLGSWVAVAFFPIFLVAIWVRARDEEKLLRRDLAGYADYESRVRYRLIPHIL